MNTDAIRKAMNAKRKAVAAFSWDPTQENARALETADIRLTGLLLDNAEELCRLAEIGEAEVDRIAEANAEPLKEDWK